MQEGVIHQNTAHELWKRFFRLSWSMHRYHILLQECIKMKEEEKFFPSSFPSRFLCAKEADYANLNIESCPYDAFIVYYTDEVLNEDQLKKKLPATNPTIRKLLAPKLSSSESYQLETLYDIYGGTSLLIGTKRNPRVLDSSCRGRIFFKEGNYIYCNPDYPVDFDPNTRITNLHLTPLSSEIMRIIDVLHWEEALPFNVVLDLSHISGLKKLLSGIKKYSLNMIHEMIEDCIEGFPSLNEDETPKDKKKRVLGEELFEEFKLLKKRRNDVVKERNDKVNFSDPDIFYHEVEKNSFDRTKVLSSICLLLTKITGRSCQYMTQEEFDNTSKESIKSDYVHVYDKNERTDRLFFIQDKKDSEARVLLEEATLYYPLELEHSLFIFINLMENIYGFSDDIIQQEGRDIGSPRDKIRFLYEEKQLISEEEYGRFVNYYVRLRNKLAHENIPFAKEQGEEKNFSENKCKHVHGQKSQKELYDEKIQNITQVSFFQEYKESIEHELGNIYNKLIKYLSKVYAQEDKDENEPPETIPSKGKSSRVEVSKETMPTPRKLTHQEAQKKIQNDEK